MVSATSASEVSNAGTRSTRFSSLKQKKMDIFLIIPVPAFAKKVEIDKIMGLGTKNYDFHEKKIARNRSKQFSMFVYRDKSIDPISFEISFPSV